MRVAVAVFPGTNCEQDIEHVYRKLLGAETFRVWHRETDLRKADLVVIPGGFSYGDYLRTGALAKLSPIMGAIREFADDGGNVLGICNGFQILCEAGLLPGALLENVGRRFLSRFVWMRVESTPSFFTQALPPGSVLSCPIAHFQGNYFADPDTLKALESNNQIVFRYCAADGTRDDANIDVNVNGSLNSIAGITNKQGNVTGLMPHPERAVEALTGLIGSNSGLAPFAQTLELRSN